MTLYSTRNMLAGMLAISFNINRKLFLILVLCIIVFSGCKKKSNEDVSLPSPTVLVAKVEQQTIPIYANYVGQTESSLQVDIRARVEGFLQEKLFEEGTTVTKGQLLYKIDDRPYVVKVNRLKAELERSKALLRKAESDFERVEPLYKQNAASERDYDEVTLGLDQAKANLLVAEAALEEAVLELGYTEIKAPVTGLVGESRLHIGALVGMQNEFLLTRVQQMDPIWVRFNMTDREFLKLRNKAKKRGETTELLSSLQQSVSISLPDGTDYTWKGDVGFTDPQVNPKTGTFAVRAVIPNPDLELQPGQFTQVRLQLGQIDNAILVPQSAIQVDLNNIYVYVVTDGNKVEIRFVELDQAWEDKVVITNGLEPSDIVIKEGMLKVKPGITVVIANPEVLSGVK